MTHSRPTQNQRILNYMDQHGSITTLQAINDLGVMRLASRISDLRKQGYCIDGVTELVKNRNGEPCRIKRYSIMEG